MANIITGFRVLISIALLFCPVFSPVFYMLYLFVGLSDSQDVVKGIDDKESGQGKAPSHSFGGK